jgi:predicted RNA-binding protein with PUA-like domain
MRKGDEVLYYHSVEGKSVVGLAKVVREAYADPTAESGDWSCVDLQPVRALARPVTLEEIKGNPKLREIGLLRQRRLSVMSLSRVEFGEVIRMAGGKSGK